MKFYKIYFGFVYCQKEKSKGFKSGERGGYATCPLRPTQRAGKVLFKDLF